MNLLIWILFGITIGIISNLLDPKPKEGGIFGAIMLGVLGGILGGFLSNLVLGLGLGGFDFISLFVALIGSLTLLTLRSVMKKF